MCGINVNVQKSSRVTLFYCYVYFQETNGTCLGYLHGGKYPQIGPKINRHIDLARINFSNNYGRCLEVTPE